MSLALFVLVTLAIDLAFGAYATDNFNGVVSVVAFYAMAAGWSYCRAWAVLRLFRITVTSLMFAMVMIASVFVSGAMALFTGYVAMAIELGAVQSVAFDLYPYAYDLYGVAATYLTVLEVMSLLAQGKRLDGSGNRIADAVCAIFAVSRLAAGAGVEAKK